MNAATLGFLIGGGDIVWLVACELLRGTRIAEPIEYWVLYAGVVGFIIACGISVALIVYALVTLDLGSS
jgi:hypothetical protein